VSPATPAPPPPSGRAWLRLENRRWSVAVGHWQVPVGRVGGSDRPTLTDHTNREIRGSAGGLVTQPVGFGIRQRVGFGGEALAERFNRLIGP
jgi:hypothetical protein